MTFTKQIFIVISLIGGIALTFLSMDQLGQVTYRLEWAWGSAEATAQGWQVINDRGYQIHVTQGYLVAYSAELITCTEENQATSSLFDLIGPQPAYAGHGQTDNESRLTASYVEDLSRPTDVTLETLTVTPHTYCQAHYLIGPAGPETTQNPPQAVDMIGHSLFIAGTYIAPESTTATPFTLHTDFPDGVISDLSAVSGDDPAITTNGERLTITIRRDLATMFDGLDFEQMSESEQARTVLRALTNGTRVTVVNEP